MKLAALAFVLVAPCAVAQTPEKKDEPARAEEQKKPLILRLDQLSPAERSGLVVHEEPKKPGDNLPELGGKSSPAYDAAAVRGSGTSAPGSPYPADTQVGSGK